MKKLRKIRDNTENLLMQLYALVVQNKTEINTKN